MASSGKLRGEIMTSHRFLLQKAIENGTFIVDLPIENGDFP